MYDSTPLFSFSPQNAGLLIQFSTPYSDDVTTGLLQTRTANSQIESLPHFNPRRILKNRDCMHRDRNVTNIRSPRFLVPTIGVLSKSAEGDTTKHSSQVTPKTTIQVSREDQVTNQG